MDSAAKASYKVGIICGSTRNPRIGPQITTFIQDTIQAHLNASSPAATATIPSITLESIDIKAFNLPLFDEPGIPQAIKNPADYKHAHTRAWSACIAPLDAFVLVTPQYNWGVPASLKNALDFLFNEWKGKPVMVVSYGGHGGGHAAAALRTVCQGLRMQVVERTVNLTYPNREFTGRCFEGKDLGLKLAVEDDDEQKVWAKERGEVVAVWEEMVGLLGGLA